MVMLKSAAIRHYWPAAWLLYYSELLCLRQAESARLLLKLLWQRLWASIHCFWLVIGSVFSWGDEENMGLQDCSGILCFCRPWGTCLGCSQRVLEAGARPFIPTRRCHFYNSSQAREVRHLLSLAGGTRALAFKPFLHPELMQFVMHFGFFRLFQPQSITTRQVQSAGRLEPMVLCFLLLAGAPHPRHHEVDLGHTKKDT